MLLLSSLAFTAVQAEEEVRASMDKLLHNYVELTSSYLFSEGSFFEAENSKKIAELIENIRESFHSVEDAKNNKLSDSFVRARIFTIQRSLDDAVKDFKEQEKESALWQLRAVASNCSGCHQKLKVEFAGLDKIYKSTDSSPYTRAQISLILRKYSSAETEFFTIASQVQKYTYELRVDALLKWMLVRFGHLSSVSDSLDKLGSIKRKGAWREYEESRITGWQRSLSSSVLSRDAVSLDDVYKHLLEKTQTGLRIKENLNEMELVLALRAFNKNIQSIGTKLDKAKALFVLGLIHARLPKPFATQLPEVYLEECILTAPGSKWAKACYDQYEELIGFTEEWLSDERIPASIEKEVERLKAAAYPKK